ncbi:MAG: toprim domain-containing protein, partial [Anaerolineae bacterium]
MTIDLEHIRSHNPIEDVIAEQFALKKSGSRFIGVEHDSLVVTPRAGFYFWNSRGEHGDVFDFVGRYHLSYGNRWNKRDATQFMEAVAYLARRGGISIERGTDLRQTAGWAERQLVQRLHDTLLNTPPALSYAMQVRGWDLQTIRLAKLGFMPSDKRRLLHDLTLSDTWRSVIHKFPSGMLVYVHLEKGRLTYLSGRSIEGKKHYNPPRDLIGEKQAYRNPVYHEEVEQVVLVEGQADAITFGAWGIPAIAIAGMSVQDGLLDSLRRHRRVFIALDNTDEAHAKALEIARQLPDRAYIPQLPEGVKDANEWLAKHGASAEDAQSLLNTAPSWLRLEVERV